MEVKEFKSGDFVGIVGDDLSEHGIPEGSTLYLAGETYIREVEDDPYLFRKAFIAARVIDRHIQADEQPFLVTAKNFTEVDERELELLKAVYEEDFSEEE